MLSNFSPSDRSIYEHSLAIWERAWLPCSIAIVAWLVNIAFYIRSKFYDRNTCLREAHPDFHTDRYDMGTCTLKHYSRDCTDVVA